MSWINLTEAERIIACDRRTTDHVFTVFCFCALLLVFLPIPAVEAQTPLLDQWYRESDNARRYIDERSELAAVMEQAREDGIPPELIMLVLQEGAAKRVPPSRLIAALEAEEERLATARRILERVDLLPIRTADIQNALRELSVYQSAGVPPDVLDSVLARTDELDRGLAAVGALAQVVGIQPLRDDTMATLGISILASELTPATYASLSSAYLRGTLNGLPPETVVRIIVDVLEAGGGLIQIDRELRTRGRRR